MGSTMCVTYRVATRSDMTQTRRATYIPSASRSRHVTVEGSLYAQDYLCHSNLLFLHYARSVTRSYYVTQLDIPYG